MKPTNDLMLCRPLFLQPSIFPSIRVVSSVSQFFASGGQSIGASASASVLPVNIQDWSPLGWTGWISLQSKGLSTVFSNTVAEKHHSLVLSFLYGPTHIHTWLLKNHIALTIWNFVSKVMSLLFNMLSRLVIAFLPRSNCLLISCLQAPSAVILEPKKLCHCFHCFLICLPWSDRPDAMIFVFLMLNFKPGFSLSSLSSTGSLVVLHFCHKGGVICIPEIIDISPSNLDSSLRFIQSGISHDVLCI